MENWRVELDKILQGIDKEETHDEDGWWETSIGAEFGRATKDVLVEFIQQELDRAREEVLLELLEKKTNYKIERVDHGYKVTQEYVLVSDIEKLLSKLTTK